MGNNFMNIKYRFQAIDGKLKWVLTVYFAVCILHFSFTPEALAVPETSSVRITDVTPSSFSVVWMTDVAADPSVEVYSDSEMTDQITDSVAITPMPVTSQEVV